MAPILDIQLTDIEFHLFSGGWKIHHILPDDVFNAQRWAGYKIHTGKPDGGSYMVGTNDIVTQDIEIIPGNPNDIHYWRMLIDKKPAAEQRRFSTPGQLLLTDLIKNEGLTPYEFHNKKFDLHSNSLKHFSGKIVHFTDFKYHLNDNQYLEKRKLALENDSHKSTILHAVFDGGAHGMVDIGLMGIFDSEKKAKEAIGTEWHIVKPVIMNVLNKKGYNG